jgi:hypothetical protein
VTEEDELIGQILRLVNVVADMKRRIEALEAKLSNAQPSGEPIAKEQVRVFLDAACADINRLS